MAISLQGALLEWRPAVAFCNLSPAAGGVDVPHLPSPPIFCSAQVLLARNWAVAFLTSLQWLLSLSYSTV
jgi:hypothetical protein